ncbi:hypothetical protein HER10_EVM0009956 [Colletotrichum scovillei]|uniref:Uncharacterized protein n=2 Tax=Colletotrichum acutatum species complex TaxID=2707335 RepID=A0A9P7R8U1_9PEZI|nr:uncharacterized protein HER10_EVM0009956 [Colletotrichum scovillei]KXH35044.1 hypothetical protein CNYM01_07830 [Colletotrichum nymphaeae SA-01]KAF4783438.1 hypothetical protein HER10_EVM0009956 [Colletotrichum scovillei]KAG7052986.1 hypothetical protein JMJ77_0000079 [Colletotrichum scovillei]KAG7071278.1 hypothetical protein JMJ76_0004151 [Colletotrichum scovillei]KAG7079567.1 hypothetical protein JMJ78_0006673 [Colletotrichum scovillei]
MRNPFKPRQAPSQSWAGRPRALSADDPVFKDLDEDERKDIESNSISQQQKTSQESNREPLKPSGSDSAVSVGSGSSSHHSVSADIGQGYAAIAGAFSGTDHSGH